MGLIAGIIAKALLLSLGLTAAGFLLFGTVVRGEFRPGVITVGIGVVLFLLLLWQGTLFYGGTLVKRYENRLLQAGEASVSSLDEALQTLPLPSELQAAIRSVKDSDAGLEAVRAVRKQTSVYLWKRVGWMAFIEIVAVFAICRVQQKTPLRRKKKTAGSYGHYRPTENF